jgi:UrcA family protein
MKRRLEMLSRVARFTAAVLSGVTASLLIAAATAQAAQDRPVVVYAQPDVNIERVPYGDLNLAASADRKALYGRVGRAVRNVCNFDSAGFSSDYRTCASLSWADARPQIHKALAQTEGLALSGGSSIAAGAITIRAVSR